LIPFTCDSCLREVNEKGDFFEFPTCDSRLREVNEKGDFFEFPACDSCLREVNEKGIFLNSLHVTLACGRSTERNFPNKEPTCLVSARRDFAQAPLEEAALAVIADEAES